MHRRKVFDRIVYTRINTELCVRVFLDSTKGATVFFQIREQQVCQTVTLQSLIFLTYTFLMATQGYIRRIQTALLTSPHTSTIRIYSISPCKRSPPWATAASRPTRHPIRFRKEKR